MTQTQTPHPGLLALQSALRERGYCHQADHKGNPQTQIAWHQIWTNGGTVLIVQIYRGSAGFEVYAPLCPSNNLDATIAAIP